MSIEQTNQLILLILNSVLTTLLSAALLGGAWLRQNMLAQQLSQVRRHYQQMTHQQITHSSATAAATASLAELDKDQRKARLKRVRDQRQRLSNQYFWSHIGTLILHVTLLAFSVSLFALALRSLLSFDGLISAALILFTLGTAGLLAGSGCILIDLIQGNSSGDSLGQSLGKVMTQLARWWQRRKSTPLIEAVRESR